MSDRYRIFGAELSPYSVKVRSYFRYKGLPHQWILRNEASQEEYQKHARLPIVPLVVTPQDHGMQDSTPILDAIEEQHPSPAVHPEDPVLRFLSVLLEEFGDEWGNKWMFHYRWARQADQLSAAARIARMRFPTADDEPYEQAMKAVIERMVDRVWFVGSNETTAPQIEATFKRAVALLERHLGTRPFLFGTRPSYADFGMWGQFYNLWTDPTPGAYITANAPSVTDWCHRLLWPRDEGGYESWSKLEPTLMPILEELVGGLFMPWTLANERAVKAGEQEFSVELTSGTWKQKPQKYHAKSLAALRQKFAAIEDGGQLDEILESAGCRPGLEK